MTSPTQASTGVTVGVSLPQDCFGELSDANAAERWTAVVETAVAAERLGYDTVWVADHLLTPYSDAVLDGWTLLGAIGQRTSRIRLGTLVLCIPFRHPALVARMAATLDVATSGRLELGLGAGWYEPEFRAFGMPFESPGTRLGRLAEACEIVKALWSGERVSYDGRHYCLDGARSSLRPVQQPHPPLTVAGMGPRALGIVARLGDRANFQGSTDRFARLSAVLAEHCRAMGIDPERIDRTWQSPPLLVRETESELAKDLAARERHHPKGQPSPKGGTPEQIIDRLRSYRALGCRTFALMCADLPDTTTLELLARDVIPELRLT